MQNGKPVPYYYSSCKLNYVQHNYTIMENELISVVVTLDACIHDYVVDAPNDYSFQRVDGGLVVPPGDGHM